MSFCQDGLEFDSNSASPMGFLRACLKSPRALRTMGKGMQSCRAPRESLFKISQDAGSRGQIDNQY